MKFLKELDVDASKYAVRPRSLEFALGTHPGWDGIGRDGMGWDGMGWDGTGRGARNYLTYFISEKAEEGPYWERLLEDKTKQHWLKVKIGFLIMFIICMLIHKLLFVSPPSLRASI